jgi:hypothetical protein
MHLALSWAKRNSMERHRILAGARPCVRDAGSSRIFDRTGLDGAAVEEDLR